MNALCGSVQGAARSLKKYACPICTALRGQPGDLDAAIGRTKRTRWDFSAFCSKPELSHHILSQ